MTLRLIVVGDARADPLVQAADDYLQRIRRWVPAEVRVVRPQRRGGSSAEAAAGEAEARAILARIKGGILIALDGSGQAVDSPGLARHLERWLSRGPVHFAIGGATGLAPEVLRRAVFVLSLGALTLPHRLARLVLSEQLYRALCILRGTPYHK